MEQGGGTLPPSRPFRASRVGDIAYSAPPPLIANSGTLVNGLGSTVAPKRSGATRGRSSTITSATQGLPQPILPPPVSRTASLVRQITPPRAAVHDVGHVQRAERLAYLRQLLLPQTPAATAAPMPPVAPQQPASRGQFPPIPRVRADSAVGGMPPPAPPPGLFVPRDASTGRRAPPHRLGDGSGHVPPPTASDDNMSVRAEQVSAHDGREEKPRRGFEEVLAWFHEHKPNTLPPEVPPPADGLRYSYLSSAALQVERPEYRLPLSENSAAMTSHFGDVVRGYVGRECLKPGQFIVPGRLPSYYKVRDHPYMDQKSTRTPAWKELVGHIDSPKAYSITAKELEASDALERRRCQLHSFVDWHLAMFADLLKGDDHNIPLMRQAFDSAAQAINQLHQEAVIASANLCLRRRDAEISKLPKGVTDETKRDLRASEFIHPHLFPEVLVSRAEEEIRAYSHRQASLHFLALQPATVYTVGGKPATQRGAKRPSDSSRGGHKRARPGSSQKGKGLNPKDGQRPPQAPKPPPPPPAKQPFRGAASGRGSRGGRGRK